MAVLKLEQTREYVPIQTIFKYDMKRVPQSEKNGGAGGHDGADFGSDEMNDLSKMVIPFTMEVYDTIKRIESLTQGLKDDKRVEKLEVEYLVLRKRLEDQERLLSRYAGGFTAVFIIVEFGSYLKALFHP